MPSKQRIAFVANTSWSMYRFRLPLLHSLIDQGYDVYVLAPRDAYSSLFEKMEGLFYIELKQLKGKSISPADDFRLYKELLRHYTLLQPDLIFHYTIKANIYGSLAAKKAICPAVSVITGLGYMFTAKNMLRFIASELYRRALKTTREVWFLNHDDQNFFIRHRLVTAAKTFLLPGEGIDTTIFYPSPYAYRPGPVSFLLIARLIEHKGINEFANAARILLQKNIHAEFNILGFSDNESAVAISKEQLLKWTSEKTITYLGKTDNVIPYIEKADCIVLPSYREGMPLSLLEGASMCKALVASDVPGCREIVHHGVNGFLCKKKDAIDLAAKMEQYYSLSAPEKTRMGIAGREMVVAGFTTGIVTALYLDKLATLKK